MPNVLRGIDWVPDLGSRIGSADWWRGAATCAALCWGAWSLGLPLAQPVTGGVEAPLEGAVAERARALAIRPLGLGSSVPRAIAAGDLVRPLAQAPERPSITLSATLGQGDRFGDALRRAGVGRDDASAAAALLAGVAPAQGLPSGTRVSLTLGRRPLRTMPRPLDQLSVRARFDLHVRMDRVNGRLAMTHQPIAVDRTPLRLQGPVGASLYRAVRAAGTPAKAVEELLKALSARVSLGRDVSASDRFDLVVERERAATGESRTGRLLYAGLTQGSRRLRLVRFGQEDGHGGEWFDADGQQERRGVMGLPVAGRVSSSFGYRMHPLLGFLKLHKGLDIAASHGSPIYAALDGVVQFAGRSGGYGNFVKLAHGGGLQSGYGHMSRIAVASGTRVARGQVIGFVGSTGLSTGPHLHWEVWRNGQAVNPRSISYDQISRLSGEKLRALRALVGRLTAVPVSGGL